MLLFLKMVILILHTLLVDEKSGHGGSLVGSDSEHTKINSRTPKDWINETFSNLSKNKNIKIYIKNFFHFF